MFTVLVMTSDRYIDAVRPFMYLFRKYWRGKTADRNIKTPQPVTIAGFTPPKWVSELGPDVKFESLGDFKDYPINKWSDSLMIALRLVKEDFVVLMLEDYWITHPVNLTAVEHAYEYMTLHPDVIKFDLAGDRRYAKDANLFYESYKTLDIILSSPQSPYQFSLMTGMWNKKLLLGVLRSNWSPWDIEIDGTTVLSQIPSIKVVGSHQWPVQHTLAFRNNQPGKLLLDELKIQDQYELRSLGLLKPWEEK